MTRTQDKIKDYVEPQAFDEVRDFAADPARVLAAYRFTDATADLLARWLDALADLPHGRGAAHAIAGLRGVGKSHLLATFAALVAVPELRARVPDAHVAASAKRLASRQCTLVRAERGTCATLIEELHAACTAVFGRAAGTWPADPAALLAAAQAHARGTLVFIIDTAYGRARRVTRDDGPLLSQLAAAAQQTDAVVALALDDDIAGAEGVNAALASTYQISYLEAEHLYRVVDLYLLRKQAQARTALHDIYLTLRHTIPNFNWSEPRFAALYPVHPLVADVAAAVRLYAPEFAFLPFAAGAALQALNRPALSLILLDEVFDRTEAELRRAEDLHPAFALYDELATTVVAQFPALQRLQVRLVLKILFILSLDGRGATARDLCAALLYHDESAARGGVQRIEELLQRLARHGPAAGLVANTDGEARYRFQVGATNKFDAALARAVERQSHTNAAVLRLLRTHAHTRFHDWPAGGDKARAVVELHLNWRGTVRAGRLVGPSVETHAPVEPVGPAAHYDWELIELAPGAPTTPPPPAAPDTAAPAGPNRRAVCRVLWQPAALTADETLSLRRLLALQTDAALGEFGAAREAALSAHTAQAERIWTRVYLTDGTLHTDGAALAWPAHDEPSAPTLAALLAQLFAPLLNARYPQHPQFTAELGAADGAQLSEQIGSGVAETSARAQELITRFALPLGLATRRGAGYTLECRETVLAQPWSRAVLAHVERAGDALVKLADLRAVLRGAPYGLLPEAQQVVLAALVAQRRLELVRADGTRLGRAALAGPLDWAEVTGAARPAELNPQLAVVSEWARRLTREPELPDIADAAGQARVRAALTAWRAEWHAQALLQQLEQLPDAGLTLRAWQLAKQVRRTYGVAAEAVGATLAGTIPLAEGLQRVADAFRNSEEHYARTARDLDALVEFTRGVAGREQVRAYLAAAEPTGVAEIDCARRELWALAADAHGLFDAAHRARFESLWQEFHPRYMAHYADLHERAVGAQCDRHALDEVTRGEAWREFEALAQLPFIDRRHWHEAGLLLAEAGRARCDLPVQTLLAARPTCVCSFRLPRAAALLAAAAHLAEIVARGRAAARRTLAVFHQNLAHALGLLAREKSAAAERARRLAEVFSKGQTPTLLTRADVRLIARAYDLNPPAQPLRVAPPGFGYEPESRAELTARLMQWVADLPQSHALVEIAGKIASDAA